jgi:hypothetical protein
MKTLIGIAILIFWLSLFVIWGINENGLHVFLYKTWLILMAIIASFSILAAFFLIAEGSME